MIDRLKNIIQYFSIDEMEKKKKNRYAKELLDAGKGI